MAKPVGPYSPVARAGDWLVVSGQIGIDDGTLVTGGMQAELRQALGTAVFYGMIGVTTFGLIFTPVFFVVCRWLAGVFAKPKAAASEDTPSPPLASPDPLGHA